MNDSGTWWSECSIDRVDVFVAIDGKEVMCGIERQCAVISSDAAAALYIRRGVCFQGGQ